MKKAVAGYFNDPKGTGNLLGTTMSGTGEGHRRHGRATRAISRNMKEKLRERRWAGAKTSLSSASRLR